MERVKILGAGLAGSEAALQLLDADIPVEIYDCKPNKLLPAYSIGDFCELVCNNSLGNLSNNSPLNLLLSELISLKSRILSLAEECRVGDVTTLSVDRVLFSNKVTETLKKKGAIIITEEISTIPDGYSPIIIATGPLTSVALAQNIAERYGLTSYAFSDASCPIIVGASIDYSSPYLKIVDDGLVAIDIPEKAFSEFYQCLLTTEKLENHIADKGDSFIQCHSLERLAHQNKETLLKVRFTPDHYNSPTLLLRRESALHDAFIMVGCTTGLSYRKQREIFSLLPALQNVKFVRYGRQHRNTFFKTPGSVDEFFQIKNQPNSVFLIGQLSGLDGYAPAIMSGLVSAQRIIRGKNMKKPPCNTMIGKLSKYVSDTSVIDYQPMCASFSLFSTQNIDEIQKISRKLIAEYIEQR